MKMYRIPRAGLLAALLAPLALHAAVLEGTVTGDDKQPIAGAMVTLFEVEQGFGETIYTDRKGRYRLETRQSGKLAFKVRRPSYRDDSRQVSIGKADGHERIDVQLKKLQVAKEVSDSLSASAHFARIKFDNAADRKKFQVDCLTCHQVGNAFTRTPRSLDQWSKTVQRMLGYWGIANDPGRVQLYANALSTAFNYEPVKTAQDHVVYPEAQPARISHWKLPGAVIPHDSEISHVDGKLYTVDEGTDKILITDLASNRTEAFDFPDNGMPPGGKFVKLGLGLPFGLTVKHGPHSLAQGADGKFYVTSAISSELAVFDPKTRQFKAHTISDKAMYPHTVRVDRQGIVWFTIAFSNQIGRFDPATERLTVIDLPTDTSRAEHPSPVPYGIDINPKDGSVWYAKLIANRLGRIDPKTMAIKEFEPPLMGPRRPRFSRDGMLWIPAYGDGTLVRLDPETMEYTAYPLPTLAPNEIEAPYSVAVHPVTQDVWVTANMADRAFRFLPKEKRFIAYPLPTRGVFLRDFTFDKDGRVCAPSSPMPPTVVEGGQQEIFCIATDGGGSNAPLAGR